RAHRRLGVLVREEGPDRRVRRQGHLHLRADVAHGRKRRPARAMSVTTIFAKGIFDGHVAIVTGGGSGIGLSTALALGTLGAKVAICGRKKEKLEEASKLLAAEKIEHWAGECDIREVEQVGAFVEGVKEKLGRASILVNNAGGQFPTTADTVSPRGWEAVIRNNLNGTFFMTQAVATKHMMPARRGRIVNVIANIAR